MKKFVLINIENQDRQYVIKVLTACGIFIYPDNNLEDVTKPVKTLLLNWKEKKYCWADYSPLSWYSDKKYTIFHTFQDFLDAIGRRKI